MRFPAEENELERDTRVMEGKIAIIGRDRSVYFFRLLGFEVFFPMNRQEVRDLLMALEQKNIAVCLLHQSFLSETKDIIEELRPKTFPIVLLFSDYQETTDSLQEWVAEMAVRITGSHELIRKRQEHEST